MNNTARHESMGHKFFLIRQYAEWGMREEARKIVDTFPSEAYYTQDLTMGYVLEGEEWKKHQKLQMIRFTIMLSAFITAYAKKADLDALQEIECLKAAMGIERIGFPIGGEKDIDHISNAFKNTRIAELYCEAGDKANALEYIEKAIQDSMYHIELMDKTKEDGSNYFAWSTPRNLCWILWEDHLMKPQFDIVKSDERFVKCFDLLKSNSRELK